MQARSVETAQRLLACNHVDLVITDHLLRDGTGAELVLQMKGVRPEVPIVLLTAWADTPPGYDHVARLLSKGITTPEDFLRQVASLLSNHNEI